MDKEIEKTDIEESAEEKMVDEAFQLLLDTYLASPHRKKVDIITKAFNFSRQAHKGYAGFQASPTFCILSG